MDQLFPLCKLIDFNRASCRQAVPRWASGMPHLDFTSQTAGLFTTRRCADDVASTTRDEPVPTQRDAVSKTKVPKNPELDRRPTA